MQNQKRISIKKKKKKSKLICYIALTLNLED